MSNKELTLNRSTTDRPWPVADLDGHRLIDCYRCFSAVRDTLMNSLNGQSFAGHIAEFGGY